jgi:acyl carrier protein
MKDRIVKILQETRPESDFLSSANFIEDALLDSFDMVVLIGELEDEFNVVIDGTDVVPENFVSIDAISRLIDSSR